MVYFESMKCTSGFCFVSCYCYVADNVKKQVGFHGNTPSSRKLIKMALTIISVYAVLNIAFNQANLLPFECSSHLEFRTGKKVSQVHTTSKSKKMP